MKIVLGTMNNFNQQGLPVSACAGTAQATAAGIAGTAVERSLDDNVQQSTISNEPTRTSGTFSGAGTGASTPSSTVVELSNKISTTSAVSSNEQPNPPDTNSVFTYNTTVVQTSTPYKYRDYSNVADAEGLEGYYSDASDPPSARRKNSSHKKSGAGNDAAPAPGGAIHDAHTMRLQKFPAKLESMLSRPEWSDIVCWMPHGRSWKVRIYICIRIFLGLYALFISCMCCWTAY